MEQNQSKGLTAMHGALSKSQRFKKRTFDLVFASAALILLVIPMLILAIVIALDSPGPSIFRQKRVGFANRPFTIFKFRTMTSNAPHHLHDENALKIGDPKSTMLGKILRRYSLDELPQLINVIRGDMSLVGPRPHTEESTVGGKFFWEVHEQYWHRHAVSPGMTGLAQIHGYLGETVEDDDLIGRLEYDLEYINEWSFGRDIKIILATVHIVVFGQDNVRRKC